METTTSSCFGFGLRVSLALKVDSVSDLMMPIASVLTWFKG